MASGSIGAITVARPARPASRDWGRIARRLVGLAVAAAFVVGATTVAREPHARQARVDTADSLHVRVYAAKVTAATARAAGASGTSALPDGGATTEPAFATPDAYGLRAASGDAPPPGLALAPAELALSFVGPRRDGDGHGSANQGVRIGHGRPQGSRGTPREAPVDRDRFAHDLARRVRLACRREAETAVLARGGETVRAHVRVEGTSLRAVAAGEATGRVARCVEGAIGATAAPIALDGRSFELTLRWARQSAR